MTDILIVEDHPTMRAAMLAVLEQEGFILREAGDGPSAMSMVAERAPDVMFLDLHMPGVSGEEVLAQIKGDPKTAGIKVIVVTAQGEEGKRTVLSLGADAYFQKPYSPLGLLQAVEQVLREHPVAVAQPQEEADVEEEAAPAYDPLWPGNR